MKTAIRPRRRLKTVVHIHTNYSVDSNCSPRELIQTARRRGVDCLAITDHDDIRGALEAREIGGIRIVIGSEITTSGGHMIGLFLEEDIPPGLTPEETARRIRGQGGLVLAPHPFLTACRHYLGPKMLDLLLWLDAVEVCNAQNILPWTDAKAARFARRHRLPAYCGADTHLRGYLDACHQYIPDFDGPASFRAALREAELVRGRFGPSYIARMAGRHLWQEVFNRPLGEFGENYYASRAIDAAA
jgi:hypothetical protein